MWVPDLFNQLLQSGIGPVHAADNPGLYHALLALLLLLLLIDIVNTVRALLLARATPSGWSQIESIIDHPLTFVIEALSVFGLWWAYSTSPQSAPIVSPPSSSAAWLLGLSALAVYHVAGTLAHTLVALLALAIVASSLGLTLAAVIALPVFRRASSGGDSLRVYALSIWIAGLIAMGSWEVLRWPVWLVVAAELYVAYWLPFRLMNEVRRRTAANKQYANPTQLTRRENIEDVIDQTVSCVAIALVMILHQTAWFPLTFFGMYLALTFVDDIVESLLLIRKPSDRGIRFARWEITVPIVLVFAWLGAAGLYQGVILNAGITPSLWLAAAAAAAAYSLFKPLVTLARKLTDERERQRPRREAPDWFGRALVVVFEAFAGANAGVEREHSAQTGMLDLPAPIVVDADIAGAAEGAESIQAGGVRLESSPTKTASSPISTNASTRSLADRFHDALLGERQNSTHIADLLGFPSFLFFLTAGAAYHYFLPSLTPLLNNHLSLLVFSLLPLLAGLLPVLNKAELDAPRYVLLLFIYFILVVTGVDALLIFANIGLALPPTTNDALATLGDPQFNQIAVHNVAQELLVLVTLGQILYLFQLIRGALESDQQQSVGSDPDGWVSFAARLFRLGEPERALEALDRVLAAHPTHLETLELKARILYGCGKTRMQEALEAVKNVLQSNPEKPAPWHNFRGDILAALNRPHDAYIAYCEAIRLNPDSPAFWLDVVNTLGALGRYDDLIAAYEALLRIVPKDAAMWRNMAAVLTQELNQHEKALVAVERALKLEGRSIRAWTIKGHALKMLGRMDEAQRALEKALRLIPGTSADADVWALSAGLYAEMRRYSEALQFIERAIEMRPNVGAHHQDRGDILLEAGRYEEALAEYEIVATLPPSSANSSFDVDSFGVLESKAKALRALGRDAEASAVEREMAALSS